MDNETYYFPQAAGTRPWLYFNVTKTEGDGSTFTAVNHTRATGSKTDFDGYANVTFLPDETFNSGNQTWLAYLYAGDLCYDYNITENFTVETDINKAPRYFNKTVNGSSTVNMQWGSIWNFNVTVIDPESNDVNVTLQIDYGTGWTDMASENCTNCENLTTINFTDVTITCAFINTSARFRFNVSDTIGNVNGTSDPTTFGILPDNVIFEIITGHGDSAIANRTPNNDTLELNLSVKDFNGTYATTNPPRTPRRNTRSGPTGGTSRSGPRNPATTPPTHTTCQTSTATTTSQQSASSTTPSLPQQGVVL